MLPLHLYIDRSRVHLPYTSRALSTSGSDTKKCAVDHAVACSVDVVDGLSSNTPLFISNIVNLQRTR
jgi:hypothetical protein